MRRKKVGAIAIKSFALLVVLGMACLAMAKDTKTTYPSMAPIEQYLTDRTAEIALARSAAPESISGDVEVLVLGRNGFETAVKGKNGFVCIVERSLTSGADPDFWKSKVGTPICWNAAAARSFLLPNIKKDRFDPGGAHERSDGRDHRECRRQEGTAGDGTRGDVLPGVEQGYGGDSIEHWPPHLMFYVSQTDPAIWGASLPRSPILALSDTREHVTTLVIAVQRWSDGTEAR